MKKIITLTILLVNLIGNAQCPAPSNLISSMPFPGAAQLSWTENGTATYWEVVVMPDFSVGDPLPNGSGITITTNSVLLTNLPQAGCAAIFIRSGCSQTEFSPWVAAAAPNCSSYVWYYMSTLSNENFSTDSATGALQLFPNPASYVAQIKSDRKIEKVTLFDALGKAILVQTQNTNEINVENLAKGIYIMEIATEKEKVYRKFIKE